MLKKATRKLSQTVTLAPKCFSSTVTESLRGTHLACAPWFPMNRGGSVWWTKDNSQATSKNSKKFWGLRTSGKCLNLCKKRFTQLGLEGRMSDIKELPSVELQSLQWATRPITSYCEGQRYCMTFCCVIMGLNMFHICQPSQRRGFVILSFRGVTCNQNSSVQCERYWVSMSNKNACVPSQHANRNWRQLQEALTALEHVMSLIQQQICSLLYLSEIQ